MNAPSAWTIQSILAIAHATLSRMEADGTLSTDEADLAATLREEVPEVDTLLLRLLRAAAEAEANARAVAERTKALDEREKRFLRQNREYRAAVYGVLDVLGLSKWRHAEYSVSVSAGRPGVVMTDEAALPDAFVRIERMPDRAAIKHALEAGEVVPGAALQNAMPSLTVRSK